MGFFKKIKKFYLFLHSFVVQWRKWSEAHAVKNSQIKFFFIKFVILNFINMISFGISYLCDMLTQTFIEDGFVQTCTVCLSGFVFFVFYVFATTSRMNNVGINTSLFVARESAAYALFLLPATVVTAVYGTDKISSLPFLRFYIPSLPGAFITGNAFAGFVIQIVIISAAVFAGKKKNDARRARENELERELRREDERYADELEERNKEE